MSSINWNDYIRDVRDFPKPGIIFKDITPLLAAPHAFRAAIDQLSERCSVLGPIDAIGAAEARGFLFAAPLAYTLGVGLVPIRKPGKLPYATLSMEYRLEYGSDALEVHSDALKPGARLLLVDDVLATGGTIKACADLARMAQADVVGFAFLMELTFLGGRSRLDDGARVISLIEC